MHTNSWEYPNLFFTACPIEDSNYRMIDGICIFYEQGKKPYEFARRNCEDKFQGNRRLNEPRSLDTFKKVRKTGVDISPDSNPWIGINYSSEKEVVSSFDYYSLAK